MVGSRCSTGTAWLENHCTQVNVTLELNAQLVKVEKVEETTLSANQARKAAMERRLRWTVRGEARVPEARDNMGAHLALDPARNALEVELGPLQIRTFRITGSPSTNS